MSKTKKAFAGRCPSILGFKDFKDLRKCRRYGCKKCWSIAIGKAIAKKHATIQKEYNYLKEAGYFEK